MRHAIVAVALWVALFISSRSNADEPSAEPPPVDVEVPPLAETEQAPRIDEPPSTEPAPRIDVPSSAEPPPSSGPRPCAARMDCPFDQRCFRNTCVDERVFRSLIGAPRRRVYADGGSFYFLGGTFQAPLPIVLSGGLGEGVGAAFRAGLVHHYFELLFDVSPQGVFNTGPQPLALLDATILVGGLVPLSPQASWVLRIGGGGGAALGGGYPATGFGELRTDVMGVVIRTSEHVRVELDAPSLRVLLDGQGLLGMSWVTALSFEYVP